MSDNQTANSRVPVILPWARQSVVLGLFMLLALAIVAPLAHHFRGSDGLAAAVTAMSICLFAGLGVLAVSEPLRRPDLVLYRVLFGMTLRMGLPLGILLAVYATGGRLVAGGLVYCVLAFYFVTLAVETVFAVRGRTRQATSSRLKRLV